MALSRLRVRPRSMLAALVSSVLLAGITVGVAQTPASAAVTSVSGYACGYIANVGIFLGPQAKLGCAPQVGTTPAPATANTLAPSVTLPSSGSASAITANDPDGAAADYGPARIVGGQWPSDVQKDPNTGPITVSTQGTPSGGTVTSSTDITLNPQPYPEVNCYSGFSGPCHAPGGFGPWPAEGESLHVECSANATSVSGSTTFSNAHLATSTDGDGNPKDQEDVPDNPPVNYTRSGVITNVGDVFTVVYNEQIIKADGSIIVNAVHMYLFGPTAVGEAIKGQVSCGVTSNTVSTADTIDPSCGTPIVAPKSATDPAPATPRTEYVGVFDAGKGAAGTGLQSITNVQVANGTVAFNDPAQPTYRRLVAGQTGPLPVVGKRTEAAEAAGLPLVWSFDATDASGNVTHCRGVSRTAASNDYYRSPPATALTVAAPGVLANDGDADGLALTAGSASNPPHGSVTLNANGGFTYTPDSGYSGTDTFTYVASDGAGGSATGTVTINAAPAAFSVNDISFVEGDQSDQAGEGTTPATFTITRSGDASAASTVKYATSAGTASSSGGFGTVDYALTTATPLTFNPLETTKQVTIAVQGDTRPEADETFKLALSAPVGAVIADTSATATILNDDGAALLGVVDRSVTEGSGGADTTVSVTVTRSGNATYPASASWKLGGTATAGSDYTSATGTVSFPAQTTPPTLAATSQTVDLHVLNDSADEANETLTLTLTAPVGAVLADTAGTVTIVDDDPGPIVPAAVPATFFTVNDHYLNEGPTPAGPTPTTPGNFIIHRSGVTTGTSTVKYKTSDSTAKAGTDYNAITTLTVLTFNPNETDKTVTVPVLQDTLPEKNETFKLLLSSPTNAVVSDSSGTANVLNDDYAAYLAVDNISVDEGASGTTIFNFNVTRSGNTDGVVTVNYATKDGTATAGSGDYTAKSGSLTFNAGDTTKPVAVNVTGDGTVEANETFTLTLSGQVGATLSDSSSTATIVDDDGSLLSISDVTQAEGTGAAGATFTFTVTRTRYTAGTSSVKYATANGSAVAFEDYNPVQTPLSLSFAAGVTTKTLTIQVTGDTNVEPNQTFFVNLSSPVGANIADGSGTGTIVNDD